MVFEVFFDVETKNLFRDIGSENPADLGVSVVSLYFREFKDYLEINSGIRSFWENEFANMWPLFEKADRIIGFNSINFDVPALSPYSPPTFKKLNHFDMLLKFKEAAGFRISLNSLAQETLGKNKTDIGTNAVQYYRKGDPESLLKLKSYCEADVLLTRDIYDFGMKNNFLKYKDKWNNIKNLNIDFSYPLTKDKSNQYSLF